MAAGHNKFCLQRAFISVFVPVSDAKSGVGLDKNGWKLDTDPLFSEDEAIGRPNDACFGGNASHRFSHCAALEIQPKLLQPGLKFDER